jgi:hypothetical protein
MSVRGVAGTRILGIRHGFKKDFPRAMWKDRDADRYYGNSLKN